MFHEKKLVCIVYVRARFLNNVQGEIARVLMTF